MDVAAGSAATDATRTRFDGAAGHDGSSLHCDGVGDAHAADGSGTLRFRDDMLPDVCSPLPTKAPGACCVAS